MKTIGANIGGLNQVNGTGQTRPFANRTGVDGGAFREQLEALQKAGLASQPQTSAPPQVLKFSNHAIDRMQARGIHFSPVELAKIQNAVQKASAKGAKNTLMLTNDSALIVSVKDNTVVTVMDKAQLRENVFTNIDSTVMI